MGVEVIDRCNLTVLQEPGQEDLAEFLAEHQVTVSLDLRAATNASPSRAVCPYLKLHLLMPQHTAVSWQVRG